MHWKKLGPQEVSSGHRPISGHILEFLGSKKRGSREEGIKNWGDRSNGGGDKLVRR